MRAGLGCPGAGAPLRANAETGLWHWSCCCHRVKPKVEEEEEEEEEEENPLLVPLEEKSVLQERQTSLWFGKVSSSVSEMKC